ncbi:MAG: protein phosphatase CheZ, partial [Deltaproteobacteria bacterium]|nr:protein phosphatase CheZ [Deltaproteobacteria bacterium]
MEYTGFHSAFEALIKSLSGQKETEPIKKFINELKEFLKHLDSTDQSSVNLILNDFEAQTQEPMFQEVGMILRKFHDQMVTIKEGIPNNLGMLADIELLDVEGKLKHILTMTDNAANKTMDLAETITEDINQQNDSNLKLLNELKTSA